MLYSSTSVPKISVNVVDLVMNSYLYHILLFSIFRDNAPPTEEELSEKDKHEKLIGQLKYV